MSAGAITIDVRAQTWLARLAGAPQRLRGALETTVTRLTILVQGAVKQKLTGEVLHVRTGTLRRSINQLVSSTAEEVRGVVGTNVAYAHIREFGFEGDVTVRAHTRRSAAQMSLARFRNRKGGGKVEIAGSYAKAGGGVGVVNVREHTMHMRMPESSFLRSSLADARPQIVADIKAAAIAAVQGA